MGYINTSTEQRYEPAVEHRSRPTRASPPSWPARKSARPWPSATAPWKSTAPAWCASTRHPPRRIWCTSWWVGWL